MESLLIQKIKMAASNLKVKKQKHIQEKHVIYVPMASDNALGLIKQNNKILNITLYTMILYLIHSHVLNV